MVHEDVGGGGQRGAAGAERGVHHQQEGQKVIEQGYHTLTQMREREVLPRTLKTNRFPKEEEEKKCIENLSRVEL